MIRVPRIFFLATDDNTPSGGRKVIYTLVDLLRELGHEAYALHQHRGFRYTWFENETPVTWTHAIRRARHSKRGQLSRLKLEAQLLLEQLQFLRKPRSPITAHSTLTTPHPLPITPKDLLVIPENRVTHLDNIFPGVPKIVFNQNSYIFLRQHGLTKRGHTLDHPDIRAWWCVSELIEETLQALKVNQPIHRIPNFIDSDLFHYAAEKKPQIAYMPRRLKDDAQALIHLLKLRGRLQGFSFVPIDNAPPREVARILKESLIFLSFSHREGFGLPPAEAMACGCVVVGYTGNAGEEFMNENLCYPVSEGDLLVFASQVEAVIGSHSTTPQALADIGKQASQSILNSYSRDRTVDALRDRMQALLGQ